MRREIEIIKSEKSSPPPLIEETTEQLRTNPSKCDVDGLRLWHFRLLLASVFPVVMLVRKQVGNPSDFFDKSFSEYQEGFSANGEF